MAPSAEIDLEAEEFSPSLGLQIPENAAKRLSKAGIDLKSYPTRPQKPDYLDEVYAIRSEYRCASCFRFHSYISKAQKGDPVKKESMSIQALGRTRRKGHF